MVNTLSRRQMSTEDYRSSYSSVDSLARVGSQSPAQRPQLVPVESPNRKSRRLPIVVRVNRALQASLIALCGLAILGYGLDVADTNKVSKQQEQVHRLSEQNSELSSRLLKAVSYQGLQDNHLVGKSGLRVPEQVKIVREVQAPKLITFKPAKHHLPLMSGY